MHKHIVRGTHVTLLQYSPLYSKRELGRVFLGHAREYTTALPAEQPKSITQVHAIKGTRTRKSFAELPKIFTAADGTPAAPLGPWPGWSANPSSEAPVTEITACEAQDGEKLQVQDPELVPKTRKRAAKTPNAPTEKKGRKSSKEKLSSPVSEVSTEAVRPPDTPLAKEIMDNLARFPHCILLTRVGQFYESYFDQAVEVAKLLNIKLTSKAWGGGRVAMCGFPLVHLNKYLKVLVQDNHRFVALCEEFMRSPKLGPKGGFDRRVSRIITPGTLIDEPFLNPYENNYLLAISSVASTVPSGRTGQNKLGLAWIDMSTGDFFTKNVDQEALQDELARISPKEIILAQGSLIEGSQSLLQAIADDGYFVSFVELSQFAMNIPEAPIAGSYATVDDLTSPAHTPEASPALTLTGVEMAAVDLLTVFLSANLLDNVPQLSSPSREAVAGRMQIDSHTIKALELKESIREGGTAGSLLNVVKRTVTSGGTRLLARWLCSPSASLNEINARQSLVAFFHARPHLRADLVQSLSQLEDATRILQKFLLGRGDSADLMAICATVGVWSSVQTRLELEKQMELQERGALVHEEWASVDIVLAKIHVLHDIVARIKTTIVCNDLSQDNMFHDGGNERSEENVTQTSSNRKAISTSLNWTIRPQFSEELTKLHKELEKCLKSKDNLEWRLQAEYYAPSLTLRSSPGHGMHVHIARAKRDASKVKNDPSFVPISQNGNTRVFFYQEWSKVGNRIVELATAISAAERAAFELLREDVNAHATEIRKNSRIMDELDVAIAYANLAEEMNLVRPIVTEDTSYHVVNGRHPTVELGLLAAGRVFNPNTVSFTAESSLHIITGPNMAGKSTLLRQTALIAILAQTGSFVPADSARIGVMDRIFSRVGAKDDLFRNRSTFMVEMLETADILRRATPNSLVIMDEVGRGTTTEDGLSIAFAAVHHLLSQNRCRTLFATHFHELADLLGCAENHQGQGAFAGVSFFCTDIDESQNGYFTYSHRLRPGVNRDSHGLRVAQLAGMPDSVIRVAQGAYQWLRQRRSIKNQHDKDSLHSLGQMLATKHDT